MTRQVQDVVTIADDPRSFVLIDWDGVEAPFDPQRFGLTPHGICSACWRGWHASYAIRDRSLTLDSLHIFLADDLLDEGSPGKEPKIFGKPLRRYILPDSFDGEDTGDFRGNRHLSPEARATDLEADLVWDGYLLLGADPSRVGGFSHPAWHYRTVVECEFVGGVLVGTWDCSSDRQRIVEWLDSGDCPQPPPYGTGSRKKLWKNWQRGFDGLMGALFRGVYGKA